MVRGSISSSCRRNEIFNMMRVAVDDVLFLTTKGTEITKFSDIFIFVPFVLSVVKNSWI